FLVASTTGMFGIFGPSLPDRQALVQLIGRLTPFQGSSESLFTPYLAAMVRHGDPDALQVGKQVMQSEERREVTKKEIEDKAADILTEATSWRNNSLSVLSAVAERVAQMPGQRLLMLLSDGFTMMDRLGNVDSYELQSVISKAVRGGV